MLAETLFAIMLAMTPPADQADAGAELRYWTIATATADVATRSSWEPREMALALLVKTWHESGRWDVRVHDGELRGDCHGEGWRRRCRSVCLGQIHAGSGVVTYHEHKRLVGTDWRSTRRCLAAAARALETARWQCRTDRIEAAYALYGTGSRCDARFARQRGWHFRRLWRRWFE